MLSIYIFLATWYCISQKVFAVIWHSLVLPQNKLRAIIVVIAHVLSVMSSNLFILNKFNFKQWIVLEVLRYSPWLIVLANLTEIIQSYEYVIQFIGFTTSRYYVKKDEVWRLCQDLNYTLYMRVTFGWLFHLHLSIECVSRRRNFCVHLRIKRIWVTILVWYE